MSFVPGDICYILENNTYITKARVMRKFGDSYIIQRIGTCGAIQLPPDELFQTEEEALASKKTPYATVSPFL